MNEQNLRDKIIIEKDKAKQKQQEGKQDNTVPTT